MVDLTPTTATLGVQALQAHTAASIELASRQLVEDHAEAGSLADLIEVNTALAIARTMDTSALYGLGPGSGQPWGIFSSQYTGTLQSVSLGTDGAAPSATATRGMFGPFSQAIERRAGRTRLASW